MGRVARACGATIVNRTDEITEEDIGKDCGLFEIRKIGDEYFTFLEQCKDPKACTIILRGASIDILKEVERNLQDALNVARNLYKALSGALEIIPRTLAQNCGANTIRTLTALRAK